ncbi:MAG: hypothetical protein ACRDFQ_09955, partial [Anaerolineales bacterium]
TQPARRQRVRLSPVPPEKKPPRGGRIRRFLRSPLTIALMTVMAALFLVSAASAAVGWSSGRGVYYATATFETGLYMLDQYNLALEDIDAGNYALARDRLEYIFSRDPNFLDIADLWVQVMLVINSTPLATDLSSLVPTPTPTTDPRPKEELMVAASALFNARDWTGTIDTLLALRKADAGFHTAEVDGMFYAALRNRGAQYIIEKGLFELGLYDFSLAEKFGPLDGQVERYREMARLYLYGNAFWLAYPEEAAYYYGLLTGLAPDLRDSNGLSAFYRYRESLIHWGDKLAKEEDWCGAYEKYQLALDARFEDDVQALANSALDQCLGPSPTPSLPFTPTFTGFPLITETETPTPTIGGPPPDTATSTPTPSETPTTSP